MLHSFDKNQVFAAGTVKTTPQFSHTVYGETFYTFKLSVPRLSGVDDDLPVTLSERLLHSCQAQLGTKLRISGQLRSYNKQIDGSNRLILTVFTHAANSAEEMTPYNEIILEGYICKDVTYRMTPFSREISDLMVAVNRAHNKADYLPCIAWGRNARFSKTLAIGTRVHLEGRIQSRNYQKMTETGETVQRTAYEVSIASISLLE